MPEFAIVDSHVHLYDPTYLRYGWLKNVPKIDRRYDLGDFDRARGSVQVEKLVFAEVAVDAGLHFAEADWVQRLADQDPRLAGMIAHAPVEKGKAVAADLERLARFPALRGIRRLIETEVDQSFCLAPDFIDGVKAVGAAGLSFDICVKHWGLVFAIALAKRCPDVAFILDHIGKPAIRHDIQEPWKSQLAELAKLDNVVMKVSGVITEADHRSWTKEQVEPYVAYAIETFGFDRVMFGSDWTVSELTHGYPDWVALLDEVLAGVDLADRQKFWRDNAIRAYRL